MNIAIIGTSEVYSDSLKTLLRQICDFNILFSSEDVSEYFLNPYSDQIDFVLIHGFKKDIQILDLFQDLTPYFNGNYLILTDFSEECLWKRLPIPSADHLLSISSTKCEMEKRIRSVHAASFTSSDISIHQ